ncbi:MAG: ribbon-helix-helix domain-containing protein [Candidatus Parcubacteria bacterium]|nr:ribbon-helix-helix domain-containing protein [Candidatus Parcubacteria bacterium]
MANRKVMSISVTPEIAKRIDGILSEGQYLSKSELFRDMLRSWEDSKIRFQVENSRKEIIKGKARILKSLKDLK